MTTPWLVLPALLLWVAGGVAIPLTCGGCEGAAEGFLCSGADSEEALSVRALPEDVLRVECRRTKVDASKDRPEDFSALRSCNLTAFRHFEFVRCPLPEVSFGEVFRRMGVSASEVVLLAFVEGTSASSPGLQEWHLDALFNLKTLQLVDNQFTSVPPALLTNTAKLEFLQLLGNGMDALPHTLLASTPDLVMADLGRNNLTSVPEDLFSNLTKLTNVSLWNNSLRDIHPNLFSDIPYLKYLDLGDNLIANIPRGQFRDMKILRKLNLGGNALRSMDEGVFDDLLSLEELRLHSNSLESLPKGCFNHLRLLKKLILRDNRIMHMPVGIFRDCESLEVLDLGFNRLKYVSSSYFPSPKTMLSYLDLGNNNISFSEKHVNHNGVSFVPLEFPLSTQIEMRHIILANNRITEMPPTLNNVYAHLQSADLSGNMIDVLDFRSIYFSSNQVKVNLKNNRIQMISLRLMGIWPIEREKNVTLSLEGNPLQCNCLLYIFTKIVQGKSDEQSKTLYKLYVDDADKVTCTDLKNKTELVQSVDYKMLTCNLERCMDKCDCYWRRHDEMFIIDCSFQGLTAIPDPDAMDYNIKKYSVTLNLLNNSIASLDGLHHPFYTRLANLTIPNNKISHFNESDLPENLKVLDLRGNNLTALPADTLDYLNTTDMTLSLGGNPWSCNCDVVDFWTFLQVPERKVLDQYDLHCAEDGALLLDINEYSVCPFFRQPMVIVTIVLITVFLLLFAVLGTMSFYKYKQGIKVWLYTHRMCLWAVTEDEIDADKKYDAFISYSHKDEEFVNTVLVPGLESGDPKYRVCLHYRDWIPGEYIQNQILQSVEDSRRTIVVLSPNFIESVWSQLEFKAAHSQALQDRTNRIIVIVYGQVPENELDERLRLYISMKTYVKWGDAKFWEKLRYIMPHPQELIQKKKQQQNGKVDKLELVKSNSKVNV